MNSSTSEQAFDPNMSSVTTESSQLSSTIGENELYLISAAFGTTWTFGLVANIIGLMAICKMELTPLNVILIGLCCSDILSILGLPFVITQLVYVTMGNDYPWYSAICKVTYPIMFVTPAVTVLLVLALSIWRMYAIHQPHRASKFMTLKRAKRITTAVWMIGIILIVPTPAYYLNVKYSAHTRSMICFYGEHHMWIARIFNIVDAVFITFVPVTLIVILCVAIGLSLLAQKSKSEKLSGNRELRKEDKNALLQLAFIVTSFLVGYVPKLIYIALILVSENLSVRLHTAIFLTSRFLLSFTESVNPIVYNIGSKAIRQSTKRTLQGIFCTCIPPAPTENSQKQQPTNEENIEMARK